MANCGDIFFKSDYDAFGNRKSMNAGGAVTTYAHDGNDRLLSESSGAGVTSYSWDDNGNMAGKAGPEGSWVYEWTCDNKMARAEKDGALEAEYAYDYRGERIRKTTPGESVNYLVDNNNRTGYSQVARETNASGAELAAYAFGDDLISQTRAGAVSFFHYDGLGSTRALTSIAGDVTDAVDYLVSCLS